MKMRFFTLPIQIPYLLFHVGFPRLDSILLIYTLNRLIWKTFSKKSEQINLFFKKSFAIDLLIFVIQTGQNAIDKPNFIML